MVNSLSSNNLGCDYTCRRVAGSWLETSPVALDDWSDGNGNSLATQWSIESFLCITRESIGDGSEESKNILTGSKTDRVLLLFRCLPKKTTDRRLEWTPISVIEQGRSSPAAIAVWSLKIDDNLATTKRVSIILEMFLPNSISPSTVQKGKICKYTDNVCVI